MILRKEIKNLLYKIVKIIEMKTNSNVKLKISKYNNK